MQINVLSMPKLCFAHNFEAEQYSNSSVMKTNRIEITVILEDGTFLEVDGKRIETHAGDVMCNTFTEPLKIYSESFHRHHTVAATFEWERASCGGLLIPTVISKEMHNEALLRMVDNFVYGFDTLNSNPTRASAKFLELLCAIDDIARKQGLYAVPGSALYTERAKRFISKHITEPLTQKEIAEHLNISPGYLCTVFKETEGMTLMKYINIQKLSRIKTLMEKENVPLYKAASIYGFGDPNYASRLHKKLFGYNITDRALNAKL